MPPETEALSARLGLRERPLTRRSRVFGFSYRQKLGRIGPFEPILGYESKGS